MSWHDLLAYVVILATATAIPGPDVAALVGTSLSSGLARSMTVLAGIMIGLRRARGRDRLTGRGSDSTRLGLGDPG